nr:MAG TPA: hypothetical protein [Caudoviricetes sp.]
MTFAIAEIFQMIIRWNKIKNRKPIVPHTHPRVN